MAMSKNNGKTPCPTCGKMVHPQGMGAHLRSHSIKAVIEAPLTEDEEIIMMPVRRSFVMQMLAEALKGVK